MRVGILRGRHNIRAPAARGHPLFGAPTACSSTPSSSSLCGVLKAWFARRA
jgi:hypothetical protein